MAVLNVFGAELNSAALNMEFAAGEDTGAALSISSAVKHSGNYSLRVNGLDSGVRAYGSLRLLSTDTAGPFFTSMWVRADTRPAANSRICRYQGGGLVPCWIELAPAGTLRIGDEDALIQTSTAVLATDGTWYQLIVEFNGTGAGATDVVRCHIYDESGTLIETIGATNRDVAATIGSFQFGGNIGAESNAAGDWYIDDVVCCDSSGASMNSVASLVGVRLVRLRPNGEGDADVQIVRGGTDSGSNFGQLDEETPNDATDYLSLTGTTAEVFSDTEDAPAAIGAGDAIPFVAIGGRIAAATAASTNWFPSIKTQAGGTEVNGTSTTVAVVAWNTHDDTAADRRYRLVQYTDPQAGGAWTKTLVNAMQVGAKGTDGNPDLWITALWAYVGYIPSAAAPQTLTPSAVAAAWSVAAPVVVEGAVTLLPAATVAAWGLPVPTVVSGAGGQTLTPAAVAGAFAVTVPTVLRGAIVLSPAAAFAAFGTFAPTLIEGSVTLTPNPVVGTFVVQTVTIPGEGGEAFYVDIVPFRLHREKRGFGL